MVTGLAVTVTGSQVAWLIVNACIGNTSGSNSPVATLRIIDGSSAILWQSGNHQLSTSGANHDADHMAAVYPILLSASPTLKLQVNSTLTGTIVRKSQTQNGSTFALTSLAVLVV